MASIRRRFTVRGIVQGVGFRPFIYRIATEHDLKGFVSNTSDGVVIEAEGSLPDLDTFEDNIHNNAPNLASISEVEVEALHLTGDPTFEIQASSETGSMATLISPDISTCRDCLAEFLDSSDRRFLYPFINCTQCGPRYTITENIPYDRPFTTMQHFIMCPACQAEYEDPDTRRFHAQPNACHDCGPQLDLLDPDGVSLVQKRAAAYLAAEEMGKGKIVAVKGLGGFHLAVDATNQEAVERLRKRKGREMKPFAVMAADLEIAKKLCRLTREEEALLTSSAAPIVLAPKRKNPGIAKAVAPNNDLLGVMLPYTPLHQLLFREDLANLVMTSANFSEEPLCTDNDEAIQRLGNIADLFLVHDRDIFIPNDDSVVTRLAGHDRPIRRSRGYVPRPLHLSTQGPPVLAVGAELKNNICLLKEDQAFVSQHMGDLKNLEGYELFRKTIRHLTTIFSTEPQLVVHDLHPDYLSSKWALEEQPVPTLAVQHHHAHLAACLAENNHDEPVIGLLMDGTGLGTDGTIWGGEVFIGDCTEYKRYASLAPMPLPGGDIAVKEPWRAALGYLFAEFGERIPDLPFLRNHHEKDQVLEILSKDLNCPKTTSCGRLFDAVAAMCGGCQTIHYEGQAAIEFMQAGGHAVGRPFAHDIVKSDDRLSLSLGPLIRDVARAVQRNEGIEKISCRFHLAMVQFLLKTAIQAKLETGISTVALSGGVFQNRVLFSALLEALQREGFQVLTHTLLPTNDGCISFGQAIIGRRTLQDRQ